jgi:hypothetical protein
VLCDRAGLLKLEHVSLDGSKVNANASKHKAMSHARMESDVERLEGYNCQAVVDEENQLILAEGLRSHQGATRLQTVFTAWRGQGPCRVDPGLPLSQPHQAPCGSDQSRERVSQRPEPPSPAKSPPNGRSQT